MIIKFNNDFEFKNSIKVDENKLAVENDSTNRIKSVTNVEKERIMRNAILTMYGSTKILSMEELLDENKDLKLKLEDDEILAIYKLARNIKIASLTAKLDKRMLDIMSGKCLLEFIDESVKDIRSIRKINPNIKWDLSINKIFNRMKTNKEHENGDTVEFMEK